MSTIIWAGSHDKNWENPLNWTGGAVPVDGDDAVIAAVANEPTINTTTTDLKSLTIDAGASLTFAAATFIAQTVTNAGTIIGNIPGSGGASGVQMFSAASTVTNSGTISGDLAAAGIFLHAGGLITNSAGGVIKGGVDGVLSRGPATTSATVTNYGTIESTGPAGVGVVFSDSSGVVNNTLTNSGTIIGQSAAVRFGAGNDLLKILPGATFTGLVDGGGGTNTLELAAGTGVGRLTGLGTSFTNFATLSVDSTAQWTVAGSGKGDLGSIAITGLNGLDTIDLTDFAFGSVTWTFANNLLVLNNGTTQDTLHIQGSFSAADFHVASDGAGGTAIVAVPPTPTPVPTPAPTPSPIAVLDTTTNQSIAATGEDYTGPVADLQHEYIINTSSDNLNIAVSTPNWFIHSGSGEDAIAASGGTNVLDGGTGSNFLTGGGGSDTFFVDDRNPAADIWSTVVGFTSGDDATIWGITQNDFNLAWLDNQGAAGAQGLTGIFTANGQPTASITLTGYTTADLTSALSITYGTTTDTPGVPGSPYINIHAN